MRRFAAPALVSFAVLALAIEAHATVISVGPGPGTPLQDPHVTVQLANSEGRCWTSEFGPEQTARNDGDRFRSTAP
jgi:hypothetical protein